MQQQKRQQRHRLEKLRDIQDSNGCLWLDTILSTGAGNCKERAILAALMLCDAFSIDDVKLLSACAPEDDLEAESPDHAVVLWHGKTGKWLIDPWVMRYHRFDVKDNVNTFKATEANPNYIKEKYNNMSLYAYVKFILKNSDKKKHFAPFQLIECGSTKTSMF